MTWFATLGARFGSKLWPLLLTSCVAEIGPAAGDTGLVGPNQNGLDPVAPGPSAAVRCDTLGATPLARLATKST